jgi:DNA recombination protein RmuC
MNEILLVIVAMMLVIVVFIGLMIFRQQNSLSSLQQQLWQVQETFLKETQAIKTTQLMQTNHWQEDLHQNMASQLAPLHQSLHGVSSMLGDLQHLHHNVASLKQVLTKEKSKGLLGEVALEAMLMSLLPSHMYTMQANHPIFDQNKVDALISLPSSHSEILIPIDAKVPLNDYEVYAKQPTQEHWSAFIKAIKTQAKSIKSKYIRPPHTSDFALMYVPFESLVLDLYQDHHLLHTIFQETNVYIVSPMTLHAFINVLLMSFKHHDLVAHSQIVIEHMSELLTHLEASNTLMKTLNKKHHEMTHALATLDQHIHHIELHLEGLELSKKTTSIEQ